VIEGVNGDDDGSRIAVDAAITAVSVDGVNVADTTAGIGIGAIVAAAAALLIAAVAAVVASEYAVVVALISKVASS
jgi:hypothetical protein